MKKFSYAHLKRPGLDAFSNGNRRMSAIDEFAERIQDKEVCEQSIIDALTGIRLWNSDYGDFDDSDLIDKVTIIRSFLRVGKVEVTVYSNSGYYNIHGTNLIVTWDPEKETYSDESDSNLESRVKNLEDELIVLKYKITELSSKIKLLINEF